MKNILIPTDFSPNAFNCIPVLTEQFPDTELSLSFVHFFRLSDSITDLLLLSRRSREYGEVSNEFYDQCEEVKLKNRNIKKIKVDFIYSGTLSYFKNYVDANRIDFILHPALCTINKLSKSSIDPTGLLIRCKVPLIRKLVNSSKAEPLFL